MEGCIPGSAGTRQTHMTLNSDSKVSWDCFGLSDGKVQETTPPHCLLVWSLFLSSFLHFHIEMAEGWQAEVYLVSGARQVGLCLPYLKQAGYNRIGVKVA